MKRFAQTSLCICVLSTLASHGFAQKTIALDKAVKEGKVELEITGLGGSTGDEDVDLDDLRAFALSFTGSD